MKLLDDSLLGPGGSLSGLEGSLFEGDRYQILRLVMVNSGSSAYVELPLDQTAALLGSNNQGKTSGLHTLKLFLLPEVNFRSCENKFGFASKDREYTGLESYRYYFPSPNSFIVLEASNPRGEFCIVLYQSNQELGYGRLAVPRPYDHIKHLFWDESTRANQGAGSHPGDMELATVVTRLKKLGARPLNDVATIREALYTRVDPSDDDTRFCLMPLVQSPSQHMMRSIKALLQLSFDIKGADHKNLPQAIANIIDADLSSQKESISIDFHRIQDDRERLSQSQREIQAVRGHMDDWSSLSSNYLNYQEQSSALRKSYQTLRTSLAIHNDTFDPELSDARVSNDTATNRYKKARAQMTALKSEYDQCKGQHVTLSREVSALTGAIALAREVLVRDAPVAGGQDQARVLTYMKACLLEVEQELEALQSQEQSQNALQRELQRKVQLQSKIQRAEAVLKQQKSSTLSYLDGHSALVLNSLHSGFSQMVITPNEEQIDAVQSFVRLLSINEQGRLLFCGTPLPGGRAQPFDAMTVKEQHIARLHELEDELQNCERKIEGYRRALTGSDEQRRESLKGKQIEIGEINREMKVVSGLDFNVDNLADKQIDLDTLNLKQAQQLEQRAALTEELKQYENECENSRERLKTLESQKKSLQIAESSLNNLSSLAGLQHLKVASIDVPTAPDDIATEANKLIQMFYNDVSVTRQSCIDKFKVLIGSGIANLEADLAFRADLTSSEFFDAFHKLKSEFDNIESRERDHRAQVMNHNHDTGRQISLLDKMDLAIRNFQNKINDDLSHIHISNLSGVRVEIGTLDSFNTLRHELKDHGTESDRLMKESFYNRLQDFCEKYLKTGGPAGGRAGRLDLERIVTSVKFIYQINGRDEVTPQSNGTSSMVNAVLLSILMHKLVPEDVVFALPVIFDEVGSLDDSNLAELRRIVEEHNFTLLVANPTNQGSIAQYIGIWHDLFLHQVTEGTPIAKCLAIYTGSSESLTDIVEDDSVAESAPEELQAEEAYQ
ncbi:hypothetical protein EOPP23_01580 [Endozoicomonas sp. OPT23]|uniref:hypothetical protein n=1 Tax=Endozoicomonas sp. OPT23 TaxID=2072845 RepID=UPI00129A4469|nr:hypothetical protein [Endozoicomonas sp. OPT23]MRI31685.1 hypothetical protein [Endozoicomonas sp. OPT23]